MTYLSWSPFEVDRVEEHRKYANENLNKIFMIIGIPGKTTFTTAQPCENAKLKYPSLSIFDWKTQFSWIIGFQEKVEMSQLSLGEWLLGDQEAYLKNLGVWNVHNVLNYIAMVLIEQYPEDLSKWYAIDETNTFELSKFIRDLYSTLL
jgi:hypothetical protein